LVRLYSELYEVWKKELQNAELQKLPEGFYAKIAEYSRKLREESRMLDKRTVKARLLKNEAENVKRMLRELMSARYKKLLKKASKEEKIPAEFLTIEEERLSNGVLPLAEAYRAFSAGLLKGQLLQKPNQEYGKLLALRFLSEIPAVIGTDMKPYGPFKVEDLASLPLENARVLIKQGIAEKVETA
jgi:DNA replication factor GINS